MLKLLEYAYINDIIPTDIPHRVFRVFNKTTTDYYIYIYPKINSLDEDWATGIMNFRLKLTESLEKLDLPNTNFIYTQSYFIYNLDHIIKRKKMVKSGHLDMTDRLCFRSIVREIMCMLITENINLQMDVYNQPSIDITDKRFQIYKPLLNSSIIFLHIRLSHERLYRPKIFVNPLSLYMDLCLLLGYKINRYRKNLNIKLFEIISFIRNYDCMLI